MHLSLINCNYIAGIVLMFASKFLAAIHLGLGFLELADLLTSNSLLKSSDHWIDGNKWDSIKVFKD